MNDDMSPAEIGRHLQRIEAAITGGFDGVRGEFEKYVLLSVHDAHLSAVEHRFRAVEADVETARRSQEARARTALTLSISSIVGLLAVVVAVWSILDGHIS